ncbi:MAG: hypothetical protein HZB81_01840 [Deltaproteobacteria bacterium]|nr:hypothetical protein [Deltaproteobacteria bacterium]
MDTIWTAIGSLATAFSFVLLAVSIWYVREQLKEMTKATAASAYIGIMNMIQDEKFRLHRRYVFTSIGVKTLDKWTEEDVRNAEAVCHSYDTVCRLARLGLYPPEWLFDSSGNSIIRSWVILTPMVEKYRKDRDDVVFWDDFEWGAGEAKKMKNRQ